MGTVLLTAGRLPVALDLARKFRAAGNRVLIADSFRLHGCRFSAAVEASFAVPGPRKDPRGFVDGLASIISKASVDLLVPMFEDALYIARQRDRIPAHCEVFCSPFELLHSLHHKWHFFQCLKRLGLEAPNTVLIEDRSQLRHLDFPGTFAVKACYSRASLKLYKTDNDHPPPPIDPSPDSPWIAQEWLEGTKFCSYTICRDGQVLAHTTYPVIFGVQDRWCVSFLAIDHPEIFEWVKQFAALTRYTGQVGFDFIKTTDGRLVALECNPRPTSGVHLFEHSDGLDRAFHRDVGLPVFPRVGTRRQIALGFLAFGWRSPDARRHPLQYIRTLLGVKDIVFCTRDPLPWLMQPAIFSAYIVQAKRCGLTIPALITHDMEWNSEQSASL